MVLPNQLIFGKFADTAELVVDISDRAPDVGYGHDGMLIQGELLIGQFFKSNFSGGEAFLQCCFGLLARRDVGVRLQDASGPPLTIAMQYPCAGDDNGAAVTPAVY